MFNKFLRFHYYYDLPVICGKVGIQGDRKHPIGKRYFADMYDITTA